MKKNLLFRTIIFSILLMFTLPGTSYAWGTDIIVNPVEGRHYSEAKISVAYDGTIYYGRLYSEGGASSPMQAYEVLKSVDNGLTFTFFTANAAGGSLKFTNFDILAAGNDAATFKLFEAKTLLDTVTENSSLTVNQLTDLGASTTILFESYTFLTNRGWESISMASDYREKNLDSAPYSFSIAAVKADTHDSIVVWTDNVGGNDLQRRALISTNRFFRNVSIAVGSTSSATSTRGLLGITWDDFQDIGDDYGHIHASFIFPDDATDSPYYGPYMIGFNASSYRKPIIVMSQKTDGTESEIGDYDIRTFILYEYIDGSINGHVADNTFSLVPSFQDAFELANHSTNSVQAHAIYDSGSEHFLFTYYNQTNETLPFSTKSLTSSASQDPILFQANYRDASTESTVAVKPRVDINKATGRIVFAWNDSGKSMFDSEVNTVSINEENMESVSNLLLYPNPATDYVNIIFNSISEQKIQLYIYDLSGSEVYTSESQVMQGENLLEVNTNNLAQGQYVLMVSSLNNSYPVKLIIK